MFGCNNRGSMFGSNDGVLFFILVFLLLFSGNGCGCGCESNCGCGDC